jgi:tetratricopeptide (TPR) repeat protein
VAYLTVFWLLWASVLFGESDLQFGRVHEVVVGAGAVAEIALPPVEGKLVEVLVLSSGIRLELLAVERVRRRIGLEGLSVEYLCWNGRGTEAFRLRNLEPRLVRPIELIVRTRPLDARRAAACAALDAGNWDGAIDGFRAVGDSQEAARALLRKGRALRDAGLRGLAIVAFEEAIATWKEVEDADDRAWAMLELGKLYVALERLEAGIETWRTASQVASQDQNMGAVSAITTEFAAVSFQQGQKDNAVAMARYAVDVVSKNGDRWVEARARAVLARILSSQGLAVEAEAARNRFEELRRDVGLVEGFCQ